VVLSPARKALVPALVVPDEQTWAVLGADPAEHGVRPGFDAKTVRRVLVPARVPTELAAALSDYGRGLVDDVPVEFGEVALAGELPVPTPLAPDGHGAQDQRHGEHEHGHGGHHDMMAIVGEPSADGLVMEPIRLSYGPIGTPLPGGLIADVTLDGDVVAESEVRALLRVEQPASPPDLLSPVAWSVAMAADTAAPATSSWLRIAAVEVERAVSHIAWLRSLGRLLDSQPLVHRCTETLASMQVSRRVAPGEPVTEAWLQAAMGQADFGECRERLEGLVTWIVRSRALRWRLGGRAVVTPGQARELELRGPVVRASGVAEDARTDDPRYGELDFAPVVHTGGDALARARVRAEEALAAVDLAVDALALAYVGSDAPAVAEAVVESPRGPVTARSATGNWTFSAPAADATRRVAADAMVGSEWSAALVGLASFDLSPWSVGT
jgi:hypothetical protein